MIEPGIINGMDEYVTLSVLALHRDFFDYVDMQARGVWDALEVPSASSRRIGVMGLGVLGQAVLARLASRRIGDQCRSRSTSRRRRSDRGARFTAPVPRNSRRGRPRASSSRAPLLAASAHLCHAACGQHDAARHGGGHCAGKHPQASARRTARRPDRQRSRLLN